MAGILGVTSTPGSEVSQLTRSTIHTGRKVEVSAGTVKRGTVLAQLTADLTFAPFDQDDTGQGATGLAVPRAICGTIDDVTISGTNQMVYAFFAGEYIADDLLWPSDISDAEKLAAIQMLEDRGIIVE